MRNAVLVILLTCLLLISGVWGLSHARASTANTAGAPSIAAPAEPLADLGLLKVDAIDPVLVGTPITYTLTVSNSGPDSALGVVVTDTLPAGLVLISALPGQGSCGSLGQVVTCGLGTIPNPGSVSIQLVALAAATGDMTNTAEAAAETADPNPQNNTASAVTTVKAPYIPTADLVLSKVDALDPVYIGTPITYTLTASNLGPDDAINVIVSDNLPVGLGFVSAAPSQGSCEHQNQLVTCQLGTLANGATATIKLVASTLTAGTKTNNALVTSGTPDPNFSNNFPVITTTVVEPYVPKANLALVKTAAADPVLVGAPITYTLTVSNLGPDSALGVVVTDTLPTSTGASLDFVSADPSQGSCVFASPKVTCSLGMIVSGLSATIELVATAPTDGQKINQAEAVSSTLDPIPLNNLDSVTITVNQPPPPPMKYLFLPLISK